MEYFDYRVGDKFLLVQRVGWRGRQFTPVTVEKVYKTGNAVMDKVDGQWRPNGTRAGREIYSRERLEPDTEELRAEINAERYVEACRTKIGVLGDALVKAANRCDDPVALWESIPEEVRKLAD